MELIIIIVLLLLVFGALPVFPYNRGWGYSPIIVILVILVLLILLGVIPIGGLGLHHHTRF